MVTATYKDGNVVWTNGVGKLGALLQADTCNHRLEIYDEDAFEVERILANMDDTYDQESFKSFFPVDVHDTSVVHRRILSIVQNNYIDGRRELEWSRSQMEGLLQFLKTPQVTLSKSRSKTSCSTHRHPTKH